MQGVILVVQQTVPNFTENVTAVKFRIRLVPNYVLFSCSHYFCAVLGLVHVRIWF